eukprot:3084399-Heterocapsa_arctica.AAC.1
MVPRPCKRRQRFRAPRHATTQCPLARVLRYQGGLHAEARSGGPQHAAAMPCARLQNCPGFGREHRESR